MVFIYYSHGVSSQYLNFTDSTFHTINMLWRKSVMKLLFLQQQKELRAEQVIMG